MIKFYFELCSINFSLIKRLKYLILCLICSLHFSTMAQSFIASSVSTNIGPSIRTICLRIICKSSMNNGFCYLGLEEATKRIFRPISNTVLQSCCWPQNNTSISNINTENGECLIVFEVGQLIQFQILNHPDDNVPQTPYPHRYEDLVVNKCATLVLPQLSWDIAASSPLQYNVSDIFPFMKFFKYVEENIVCPSAGILHTPRVNVQIENKPNGKTRAYITQWSNGMPFTFDFPVKAVASVAVPPEAVSCIVILGLGRPWAGRDPHMPFNPKRCYILVVGIVYLPN